jgi:hypothetical protein
MVVRVVNLVNCDLPVMNSPALTNVGDFHEFEQLRRMLPNYRAMLAMWSLLVRSFICGWVLLRSISGADRSIEINMVTGSAAEDRKDRAVNFVLRDHHSPAKAMRSFCGAHTISRENGVFLKVYLEQNMGVDLAATAEAYTDDTIVNSPNTIDGVLAWGRAALHINLAYLTGEEQSVVFVLPAFTAVVDVQVSDFCKTHSISGLRCSGLHFEVQSYLTCLYRRPEGVTLGCLFETMHYAEDVRELYFHVDVHNIDQKITVRKYFNSQLTEFATEASKFCQEQHLPRETCLGFFQSVRAKLGAYYGGDPDELDVTLYIYYVAAQLVAERISAARAQNLPLQQAHRAQANGAVLGLVDVDFIEIGTSNFNTISQLMDPTDPLVGLAVEPYAAYLEQLPPRPGVSKVNAAIVSEADALRGVGTVDLYYIPEEVIEREGLGRFLKGCNRIGDYHQMHVMGGFQQYVRVAKVPAVSIRQLLTSNRVRRIRLLKIDAEGYDSTIMHELYLYLVARGDSLLYPERIIFETNEPALRQRYAEIIHEYVSLGYRLAFYSTDAILEYLR